MKHLDPTGSGKVAVPELRWLLSKKGDCFDDVDMDNMIKEIDPDKSGFVQIEDLAVTMFYGKGGVKEGEKNQFTPKEKPAAAAKKKAPAKGKKKGR